MQTDNLQHYATTPTPQPEVERLEPVESAQTSSPPRVWALLEERAGDDNQVLNLVNALGWPCEFKKPLFSLLDVAVHRLTRSARWRPGPASVLAPPWPDLLITIGGRSAVAARWVKSQSGGRTRLVCLGRPWAPLDWFDLVITTPQYRLPRRPNVLHNPLPLNRPPEVQQSPYMALWRSAIEQMPRPLTAVIVGGSNGTYRFDDRVARDLGERVDNLARKSGGSLLVATSPRTDPDAGRVLMESIGSPKLGFLWRPDARNSNPYALFLQVADQIVVTGDSASMIAEACETDASVFLYELPETFRTRVLNRLQRSKSAAAEDRWSDGLVSRGLWVPPRDMTRLYDRLLARGSVARLGEPPASRAELPDLDMTLRRIRRLVQQDS